MADNDTSTNDAGKKPDDDTGKPAVTFKTNDEFMHAVHQRSAKLVEKAAKEAAAKARAEVLAGLELDEDENLDEVKTRLATSKKTKGEVEQLNATLKKLD